MTLNLSIDVSFCGVRKKKQKNRCLAWEAPMAKTVFLPGGKDTRKSWEAVKIKNSLFTS